MSELGLVVMADHWGRHPSSAQHLVRQLLGTMTISWVNTVGTRRPKLSGSDLRRAAGYLMEAIRGAPTQVSSAIEPEIISPLMYPGFRSGWQRGLNRMAISGAISGSRAARCHQTIGVTTLPISADLVGRAPVDHWIYYAVDDFSVWPGLDHEVMLRMESELIDKVDRVVAVSENIRDRVQGRGVHADLLTHGIDLAHWCRRSPGTERGRRNALPTFLFWGVIDRRLDLAWCRVLGRLGRLVLAGPQQDPDPGLQAISGLELLGPVDYEDLPELATQADVLVMPYADLPVTRAMQPLKFKEYLATGLPVVARSLPAVTPWADAADLVNTEQALEAAVQRCLLEGVANDQQAARQRLELETWSEKARVLGDVVRALARSGVGQKAA